MRKMPSLEKVVADTLTAIENGKNQIYDIAENARTETERIKKELIALQKQVIDTIEQVDAQEKLERAARNRLAYVSKKYKKFTEEEIKFAYERAREFQVELASLRERERQLKLRRNELEISLRRLMSTVDKAEGLVTQVGVVLDYLSGNLRWINDELEVVNQKRQLAPRIIQAQEEERRRVAREIHDGPAQTMANVVLRSEVCEHLLEENDLAAAKKELQELKQHVRSCLQDVRRIIFDLRPMSLDDLGLVPALSHYLEKVGEKSDLKVEMSYTGTERRIESAVEVALYRVVQEGVQNAIKHSKATDLKISLDFGADSIVVVIKDNGCGFDTVGYLEEHNSTSYGILGMKERLEILGGQFTVNSKVGYGTEILATIPLDE